jgi:hypothetical protein
MRNIFVILILVFSYSISANASIINIVCKNLKGSGVYYFTYSGNNKFENNKFLPHSDAFTGATLYINMNTLSKIYTLSFLNPKSSGDTPSRSALVPLILNSLQYSFVGMLSGAPILVTFYPEQNILIYSLQTTWDPYAKGAKATLMYSNCETNIK